MQDGNYLIPANSKRAQLIFNVFRPIDLAIVGTGGAVSFITFMIFKPDSLWLAILILMPLFITAFLVLPVPNYHNILCVFQNIYRFYFVDKRQYTWKGWCVKDEYKD